MSANLEELPVEELVEEIHIQTHDMDPLLALVFTVLCNRLMEATGRLDYAQKQEASAWQRYRRERQAHDRCKRDLKQEKQRHRSRL